MSSLAALLATINSAVAVVLFAALTVVVALQVLTRFVLHAPMIWSEEVARFLFFWVVLLGAALGVRHRRHFVIDVTGGLSERVGRTGRLLFDAIPQLCILAFTVFLAVKGLEYAWGGLLRTAPNSAINMALVYGAIPLFAVLSALYAGVGLAEDVRAFRSGHRASPVPLEEAE